MRLLSCLFQGVKPTLREALLSLIVFPYFPMSSTSVKTGFAFINKQTDGRTGTTLKNSFWVKAFLGGTRWLQEWLLTILETMTNNNRVGSNVDLFCKLYYNFDQNGPGQGWFDPPLLFSCFLSLLFFSFF